MTPDVGLRVMGKALVGGRVCGVGLIKRPTALGRGRMCAAGRRGVLVANAWAGLELIGYGLVGKQARYLVKRIFDRPTGWS